MEGDRNGRAFRFPKRISIHSLRMEGDRIQLEFRCQGFPISIHSLRMEGDLLVLLAVQLVKISIHSLRMEGDSR